jgi:methylamine dehydrogenase accessory protein MauD
VIARYEKERLIMDILMLIARLLLSGVFLVAGLAKLADRAGSRQAVIAFGVPTPLATPLGVLLPLVELAVAIALLPSMARWGALGAFALLLGFVAAIGVNLVRGRNPECHCFGQLHSAPVGWKTLARNGVLAALAGFVVWQGGEGDAGPSAVGWIGALSVTQLLILVVGGAILALLAGLWLFLLHLLKQNGQLLVRVEELEARPVWGGLRCGSPNGAQHAQPAAGLPVGSEAPNLGLEDLRGERLTLDSVSSSGKPVMLLFTDPNCGPCNTLLPEVSRWQEEHREKLTVALISRGDGEEGRAKAQEHGLTNVLLQEDWEVSEAYQVSGTPSAVLIRPDGTIGSPVAAGAETIRTLVTQVVEAPTHVPLLPGAPAPPDIPQGQPCPKCGKVHAAAPSMPAALKVGELAPEVALADLEGNTVRLADFRGKETLVLFWNPGCGFCQQMLPDLKEWEADPPKGAPRLLFVSAGTEEANKQMGLSSTVVLDQQFAVGRSCGATGTPSAVLVDEEGRVASEVAVGAPAILELAGAGQTKT